MSQSQLIALLATAPYAGLTDAAAAALASTPITQTRTGLLTFTTLSSSSVWGAAKTAQYRAAFQAAAAAGIAPGASAPAVSLGALAGLIYDLLAGGGILLSDPQIAAEIATLVDAGLLTQADAAIVLNQSVLPVGVAVQTSDVSVARAAAATQAGNATLGRLQSQLILGSQAAQSLVAAARTALAANPSAAMPTTAQLIAAFTAQITG